MIEKFTSEQLSLLQILKQWLKAISNNPDKATYTVTALEQHVNNIFDQGLSFENEGKGNFFLLYGAPADFLTLTQMQINEVMDHFKLTHSPTLFEEGSSIEGEVEGDPPFTPWYEEQKSNMNFRMWGRFKEYMIEQDFPLQGLINVDTDSDNIIKKLQSPEVEGEWERKGLVIGHVQQGKTQNYLAVINKAADVGYKVIVVLTGITSSLRDQTQDRTDEGFIGKRENLSIDIPAETVGVGNIEVFPGPQPNPVAHTKCLDGDLNNKALLGTSLNIESNPHIFVIKKNVHILQNLIDTFLSYNPPSEYSLNQEDEKLIDVPLLLIDDEADNASVNTKKLGDPNNPNDPTAINKKIREFLNLFEKRCYVGYTATPFANCFIQHDAESKMLGHDLFPANFINVMSVPSNYIGAERLFPIDDEISYQVREINDNEPLLPIFPPPNKSFKLSDVPESMIKAMREFIILTTIRKIRGTGNKHSTMLINAQWRIPILEQIYEHIREKFYLIQNAVSVHSKKPYEQALESSEMKYLYEAYEVIRLEWEKYESGNDYATLPSWEEVQKQLNDTVQTNMVVLKIFGNDSQELAYDQYPNGRSVIAVGGQQLSRGLTLEGLCCSYLMRSTAQADTLLQMGRFFGYRDGFADLCRVWLDPETINRLSDSTKWTYELRSLVTKYEGLGISPRNFGIQVRSNPGYLSITAGNKMLSAASMPRVTFAGQSNQTNYILSDPNISKANQSAMIAFIEQIGAKSQKCLAPRPEIYRNTTADEFKTKILSDGKRSIGYWVENVDAEDIIKFLNSYNNHALSLGTEPDNIIPYIKARYQELKHWDVLIASNINGRSLSFKGLNEPINPRSRRAILGEGYYLMATIQNGIQGGVAILNQGDWGFGLTDKQAIMSKDFLDRKVEGNYAPENQNKARGKPALILQPTYLTSDTDTTDTEVAGDDDWVALWAIQFPQTAIGEDDSVMVNNSVGIALAEIQATYSDPDDEEEY